MVKHLIENMLKKQATLLARGGFSQYQLRQLQTTVQRLIKNDERSLEKV
jgi:hypothetical protein